MTTEKMIEELYKVAGQHKNDVVGVGELNIHAMCTDVASRLKELYEQTKLDTDTNVGNKWIPCSERLPNKDEYLKNDGRFIVTDGNRVYQSIYDIYSSHCFRTLVLFDFGSRSNFEVDNCVIAWKPLPEPYKEGET